MFSVRIITIVLFLIMGVLGNHDVYAKTFKTAFSSFHKVEKNIGAKDHIIFVDTDEKTFTVKSFNAAGNLVVAIIGSERDGYTLTRYRGDTAVSKVIDAVVVNSKDKKLSITTSNRKAFDDWLPKYLEALVKSMHAKKSGVSPEEFEKYGESCAKNYFWCATFSGPIGQLFCFAKLLYCLAQAPDVNYGWVVTDEHCGRDGCKDGEKCCDTGECVKMNTPCPTPDFGNPR